MNSPIRGLDRRVRIWIIAYRQIVLDSLANSFEKKKQYASVYKSDLETAYSISPQHVDADVAVIYLEPGDSIDIVHALHTKSPDLKIIAITDPNDSDRSVTILKFGAVGIVPTTIGSNSLFEAVRKTHEGETWLNQELVTNVLRKGARTSTGGQIHASEALTPREMEVIGMIAEGLRSKAIAERLLISQATVRHHLSSIYGKLGVDGRLNLMIYAVENGLVRFEHSP